MNTSELETLIRTILSEQLTPAQTPNPAQGKGIFQSVSEDGLGHGVIPVVRDGTDRCRSRLLRSACACSLGNMSVRVNAKSPSPTNRGCNPGICGMTLCVWLT